MWTNSCCICNVWLSDVFPEHLAKSGRPNHRVIFIERLKTKGFLSNFVSVRPPMISHRKIKTKTMRTI